MRITRLCQAVGLGIDIIKQLFSPEATTVSGKLYSPEHDQSFSIQDAKLHIFKDKNTDRLKLSINGKNIIDWFKEKYQELMQAVKPIQKSEIKKSKGIGR